MAPSRFPRASKLLLGLALFGLAAMIAAIVAAGGVRELMARDAPRMEYLWLRQGLGRAEVVADRAALGAGRASTQAAAQALERAILYSRASARRTGTRPVPPAIRQQLQDYFPGHILFKVRWSFPNRELDLGSAVAAWYRSHGGAVTLQDTIVFSTPRSAANRHLWAHELTHALQYEELGTQDFARVYVTNPHLLERQAWDNARRIVRDLELRSRASAAGRTGNSFKG